MSTEPQTPATPEKVPSTNPLANPALEQAEVPEVLDFLKENGLSVLIGVGLAALVFVGFSVYRNYKQTQEITASSQLFNSRAAEQYQQVAEQFAGTSAAPLAQMALAGEYYDQGQFELAQHAFSVFLQRYPEHPMRLSVELGNLQCLEALGRFDEALTGYTAFAEANKGRYVEAAAVFGKGRCLEQLGRLAEARATYEDFMLADPKGRWASRAEYALQYVDKDLRAASRKP